MSAAFQGQTTLNEADEGLVSIPPWLKHYNRVISRKPSPAPYVGPSVCSVCCTFFSIFGALFLFVVASLMRSNYRYIHISPIEGEDLPSMSKQVTYAGFFYLVCGLVSLCYWNKGNMAKKDAEVSARVT